MIFKAFYSCCKCEKVDTSSRLYSVFCILYNNLIAVLYCNFNCIICTWQDTARQEIFESIICVWFVQILWYFIWYLFKCGMRLSEKSSLGKPDFFIKNRHNVKREIIYVAAVIRRKYPLAQHVFLRTEKLCIGISIQQCPLTHCRSLVVKEGLLYYTSMLGS